MFEAGVAGTVEANWTFSVSFALMKDNSLLFCIAYQRLNAVTERNSYSIHPIDDCIDSLGKAKTFSAFDANFGNWQIKMDDSGIDETAFVPRHGLSKYTIVPVEFRNDPETFQPCNRRHAGLSGTATRHFH